MTETAQNMLLYIEDDQAQARLVQKRLEHHGYLVELAETAQKGIKRYDPEIHRAVLLDYRMPDGDGLKVLRRLRTQNENELPPVIMLTGAGNEKVAVEALKLGATDYIIKDVDQAFLELLPAVIEGALYTVDLKKQNKKQQEELSYYARELEKRNEVLRRMAYHDGLTGLANRLLFQNDLEKALARARRSRRSLAMLRVDVDGLHEINNEFGMVGGDEVLKQAVQRLNTVIRDCDCMYRLSGAEFILLAEGMENPQNAARVASKMLEAFHSPFQTMGKQVTLSASIGIAVFPQDGGSSAELCERADEALRLAQRQQGNSFAFYNAGTTVEKRERG